LDYKEDILAYFKEIETQCRECTEKDKAILKNLKSALEANVKRMVE
jgi:hypothetical protein